MPLLWSPTIRPGSPRYVPRPYVTRFVMDWLPNIQLAPPPTGVWRELVYGGYELHVTVNPYAWAWSSRSWDMLNLFSDVYVTPPGGGAPLSAGAIELAYFIDGVNSQPTIDFVNAPSTGHYTYYKLPPAPPTYYGSPIPDLPPP